MMLGAVGTFVSTVGSAALTATAAVAEDAASFVEAYPTVALVAAGAMAYEAFSNNPDHLGNSVDTSA